MINIDKVVGYDCIDFQLYTMDDWYGDRLFGAVSPEDGTGYPVIITKNGDIYKVLGHDVFGGDMPQWDGVVWYEK